MSNINIHNADVIEWLKNYNGPKFHSVISDPPYGLAFMGKTWDKFTPIEYQNWVTEWASELIKHLYPGAVCMFFGGTRTYHRLATGLEDAGFEIFDSMMFLYGSGFPKATDISKGIDKKFGLDREIVDTVKKLHISNSNTNDGWVRPSHYDKNGNAKNTMDITKPNHPLAQKWNGYKTALKPAYEPIVLCRKPRGKETFVDCALNYGTGSLNVDGTRIQTTDKLGGGGYSTPMNDGWDRPYRHDENRKQDLEQKKNERVELAEMLGRFPANLGLICDCEKEPCECDYQTIGDSARFFYTAKSSRKERNLGLDHLEVSKSENISGGGGVNHHKADAYQARKTDRLNNHPTVKPIKLIEYLATMLKPPVEDSSILIPFSGSGSEIIGAMFAGWNVINAIEIDENYCNIAKHRVDYWKQFSTYADGLKDKQG